MQIKIIKQMNTWSGSRIEPETITDLPNEQALELIENFSAEPLDMVEYWRAREYQAMDFNKMTTSFYEFATIPAKAETATIKPRRKKDK